MKKKLCRAAIAPIQTELEDVKKRRDALKTKQEGKKDEDIPTVEKDELNDLDKKWDESKHRRFYFWRICRQKQSGTPVDRPGVVAKQYAER